LGKIFGYAHNLVPFFIETVSSRKHGSKTKIKKRGENQPEFQATTHHLKSLFINK
jgi:hypothetical protein